MTPVTFVRYVNTKKLEAWLRKKTGANVARLVTFSDSRAAIVAFLADQGIAPDFADQTITRVDTAGGNDHVSVRLSGDGDEFRKLCELLNQI